MPYIKSSEGAVYLVNDEQKVTRDVLEAEVNQAKEQLERLETELKNFDNASGAVATPEAPVQPEPIPEEVQAVVPETVQAEPVVADPPVAPTESPATAEVPNIVIQ